MLRELSGPAVEEKVERRLPEGGFKLVEILERSGSGKVFCELCQSQSINVDVNGCLTLGSERSGTRDLLLERLLFG